MSVGPIGGDATPPIPEDKDARQQADMLKSQITAFADTIRGMMQDPHHAETSKLDVLATQIEILKQTANRAANP